MTVFAGNRSLLDLFRRGEREALATVYRFYVNAVEAVVRCGFTLEARGACIPGVREPECQRDLVQEVFLRGFAERARLAYDGLSPYRPYLLRIAKNLLIDRGRKAGRLIGVADLTDADAAHPDLSPVQEAGLEEELQWQTLREAARDFCATLEPDVQRYVRLRFEEEKSQVEVAQLMGVTRRRVRTWESLVRQGLRRHLQRRGLDNGN